MKRICAILCIGILLSFSSITKANFIPASVKENHNDKVDYTLRNVRKEWWAEYTYIIDDSGKAKELKLLNTSQHAPEDVKEYLTQWLGNIEFVSAQYNKKKVNSGVSQLFQRSAYSSTSSNKGLSVGYLNTYDETNELLKNNQISEAKAKLDVLIGERTKNLKEQTLTAWLKSLYYYKVEDWSKYGDALADAVTFYTMLPESYQVTAIQNLVDFYIFKQEFPLALEAAEKFKNLSHVNNGQQAFEAYQTQISEHLKTIKQFENRYEITTEFSKNIAFALEKITLQFDSTKPIEVMKLCGNSVALFSVNGTMEFTVGTQDIACSLVVTSEQNEIIKVTHSGKML